MPITLGRGNVVVLSAYVIGLVEGVKNVPLILHLSSRERAVVYFSADLSYLTATRRLPKSGLKGWKKCQLKWDFFTRVDTRSLRVTD
jgi:hypothetical protein